MTLSKERIENLIEFNAEGSDCQANAEQWEVNELARIALASLEAEPVAQVLSSRAGNDTSTIDIALSEGTILFTAPPAPVSVPADVMSALQKVARIRLDLNDFDGDRRGIAECLDEAEEALIEVVNRRAAMLQGAEPVTTANKLPEETGSLLQLRNLIRQRHAEWSHATFGDVGPVGPLKHLSKEALEAAAEPEDLSEWADMQFLLWDAQRRAGISDGEITAAMEEKLKVNMARQWPEPKDGEPRLHIKADGNSPVIPDGWVSCSDQNPEKGRCLALFGKRTKENCDPYVDEGYLGSDGEFYFFDWESGPRIDDCHPYDKAIVSHWMYWELPAAPQQEVK